MKKIITSILGVALTPVLAFAATFSFQPAIGSYQAGDTFSVSVLVTPAAGETITATQVALSFPADKLEVVKYEPINGGSILAHVGTNHDNAAGSIIDNIAFNPGITTPTKVAVVTFRAKDAGAATLAVAPEAKTLDPNNTNTLTQPTPATYTVVAAQTETAPAPAPQTQQTSAPQTGTEPKPETPAPATTQTAKKDTADEAASAAEAETTTPTTTETTTEQAAEDTATEQAAAAGFAGKSLWWWVLAAVVIIGAIVVALWRRRQS